MEILFDRIMEDKENLEFLRLVLELLDLTPLDLQVRGIKYREKAEYLCMNDIDHAAVHLCNAVLAYQNYKMNQIR